MFAEDYETLPKSLSKYQKQFTLKRSSGRDGSWSTEQISY